MGCYSFHKTSIFFQSILSKPGAVFHFLPPQNAQHTENPSITNPRSNFLSALCFTHTILLDWKDVSLTHIRYALFSSHDKLQKEKGSPLRSGLYETPSLLVPGFLKRKNISYRRSQVCSLCQMLAERLFLTDDVESQFLRHMSSGPDLSKYCSLWFLCEWDEKVRNHLKKINRG